MFKKKELTNGRAHKLGAQLGKEVRFAKGHRSGKASTPYTAYAQWNKRSHEKVNRASTVIAMSEEEKALFPDIWAALVSQIPVREDESRIGPFKRQEQVIEANVCSALRIYRRCSRNCTPRAFGGCKGWEKFKTCPQPAAKMEEIPSEKESDRKMAEKIAKKFGGKNPPKPRTQEEILATLQGLIERI